METTNTEVKCGDHIVIIDNHYCEDYFKVGQHAKLTKYDGDHWWAMFSDHFFRDGEWCVGNNGKHFEVIE